MKLFRNAGILSSLVWVGLANLTGCSNAAQEASNNDVPVAQQVTLATANRPALVGAVLQGHYQYTDSENDREKDTLKAWLRDGQPIDGADQDHYTATAQDSGKNLQFRVTPASASGRSPGAAAVSPVGIMIENSAPVVTLTALVGAASTTATGVGSELRVDFSYSDVDGDAAATAEILWLRNGSPILNATGPTYTVVRADLGSLLVAEVTPLALKGELRGTAVRSPAVFITNSVPVAQSVELKASTTGAIIGSTLTASYAYFDADNDLEAGSSIQWLRDGAAIPGVTSQNYTLTLSDSGKTIAVEVTPLAQTGALVGLPVSSSVAVASANVALNVNPGLKQLRFSWAEVLGVSSYRVSYNPDGISGFVPVSTTSGNLTTTTYDWDISVHRINWPKAQFMLEACDSSGCLPSANISALNVMLGAIGYFKASNTGAFEYFGIALALSADGNTLAVGAYGENSAATGVGGNQTDGCATTPATNCAANSGAVYVYTRTNGNWSPQPTYVKASNRVGQFGRSLALSVDGNTLAVGAAEDSAATGIGGNQVDGCTAVPETNCAPGSGAVYVYARANGSWSPQPTYVKASNRVRLFGSSLALSADGNTLAVGADRENSAATGIGGNQTNGCAAVPMTNCAAVSGAVYVYTRVNGTWLPQPTYVKASNTGTWDLFGRSLALSADGNTLAVGASGENSAATGVGGNQTAGCTAVPRTNCA